MQPIVIPCIQSNDKENASKKRAQMLDDLRRASKKLLVQPNPLNSTDALKLKSELSEDGDKGRETPIVKSLFDIKGNSKFKNAGPS